MDNPDSEPMLASWADFQKKEPVRAPMEKRCTGVEMSKTLPGSRCRTFCHEVLCMAPEERLGAMSQTKEPAQADEDVSRAVARQSSAAHREQIRSTAMQQGAPERCHCTGN